MIVKESYKQWKYLNKSRSLFWLIVISFILCILILLYKYFILIPIRNTFHNFFHPKSKIENLQKQTKPKTETKQKTEEKTLINTDYSAPKKSVMEYNSIMDYNYTPSKETKSKQELLREEKEAKRAQKAALKQQKKAEKEAEKQKKQELKKIKKEQKQAEKLKNKITDNEGNKEENAE